MSKFIILHGTDGSPESNWFAWLQEYLTKLGHEVWLPQLPSAERPSSTTYIDFILSSSPFILDNDTIVIAHSSGAVAALYLLQKLGDQSNLKAAILVSAFKDDLGWSALKNLFEYPLDFRLIQQCCSDITFIHSDNDPYCPLSHAQYLAANTNGKLLVLENQGHFNTELGPQYKQFPQILDVIKNTLK